MKIKNSKHKVAIFCGSMFGSSKEYKDIAVKVTEYLCKQHYDIVYGGGENGLMGVVANTALKNKLNIPWIADFRDPWTKIDFYDKLRLSNRADRKQIELVTEKNKDVTKIVGLKASIQPGDVITVNESFF